MSTLMDDLPLEGFFPAGHAVLLEQLLQVCGDFRLAVVGGAVRDVLLHREHRDPWRGLVDLDLVVEGDFSLAQESAESPAQRLVQRLLQRLGPTSLSFCRVHGRYGTVELECDGLLLDIASARSEHYPIAAENPRVDFGNLEDDLARRDFSINAIALVLDPEGGRMLDPHGGRRDLANRQLRLLHALSLRDDPTRLLRAARYAARLDFSLEPSSLRQAQQTLSSWPWPWHFGDPPELAPPALGTRLRMELELLLEHEPWVQGLALLQQWGGLQLFDPKLQTDDDLHRRIRCAQRFGTARIVALVAGASDPVALAERLQLSHHHQMMLRRHRRFMRRLEELEEREIDAWGPSAWTRWLEADPSCKEVVPLALACGPRQRRPLLHWWFRWRHVRPAVTARELLAQGWKPGPSLGVQLRQSRQEILDRLAWRR